MNNIDVEAFQIWQSKFSSNRLLTIYKNNITDRWECVLINSYGSATGRVEASEKILLENWIFTMVLGYTTLSETLVGPCASHL